MKAIMPVAGEGTRLRPHTHAWTKHLMNVAGKPMIQHIIDELRSIGVDEMVFIVGYRGNQIEKWVTETYPEMNFHFAEQKERKGLGHAIYMGKEFSETDEEILIVLGDTLFEGDLSGVINTENDGAIVVKNVEDPRRWGVIETDENKIITKLVEKPDYIKPMPAMVGIYYFKSTDKLYGAIETLIEKDIKTRGEYQITDAIQIMVDEGAKLSTYYLEGWYDCGTKDDVLSTNKYLLGKACNYFKGRNNCVVIEPVHIHDEAVVENCIIGPNTTIDKNAKVTNSIIENSIINADAEVTNTNLKDSIIGSSAIVKGSKRVINLGDHSEFEEKND
jgi:glucose-1-phosphate thymidylyltransferase